MAALVEVSKLNAYAVLDLTSELATKLNAYSILEGSPPAPVSTVSAFSKLNAYAVMGSGNAFVSKLNAYGVLTAQSAGAIYTWQWL